MEGWYDHYRAWWSGWEEPDLDADRVGGPAGDASGTAGGLVVGEDVAGLEYPEDLVPWTAPAAVSSATEGLGHAGAGGHATGWAQQTVTGN